MKLKTGLKTFESTKPSWKEVLFTKELWTLFKMTIGFTFMYIFALAYFGFIELKDKFSR